MSETRWTPGPWDIHEDDGQPIAGIREREGGRFVALTQFDAEDCRTVEAANARRAECAANARLISAAPDLYAVLADLVDALERFGRLGSPRVVAARAALAKARGEVP